METGHFTKKESDRTQELHKMGNKNSQWPDICWRPNVQSWTFILFIGIDKVKRELKEGNVNYLRKQVVKSFWIYISECCIRVG